VTIVDYNDGKGNIGTDPPEHIVFIKEVQTNVDAKGDLTVTVIYEDASGWVE